MSLINQMLQELDARRVDAAGGAPYEQVRAVPLRRGVHPAWWLAIALAVALAGVIGWLLLRPPVVMPQQAPAKAKLPLKLDPELTLAQMPVPVASSQRETTPELRAPSTVPEPLKPVEATQPASVQTGSAKEGAEHAAKGQQAAAADRVPATLPRNSVASTRAEITNTSAGAASTRDRSPVGPSSMAAAAKEADIQTMVTVKKQLPETTPQQRAENEYRKALQLIQQGRASEAGALLELAIQLDPRHAGARQALIGVLLENKQQEEAMRQARSGLELDPRQTGLAMILARLQLEKGLLAPAIEILESSLPYASDRADYQAFLAALLQRAERHKQATEHYALALQKAPQNGVWWMGLGISLQADGRATEAREAFKRAKASNALSAELLSFVDARLAQLQR